MKRTSIRMLLGLALAGVPVGWSLARIVDVWSGALPRVPRASPLLLLAFAGVLLLLARAVTGWLGERRHDRRVDALTIARMVVLAKAGSATGAVLAGGYGGIAIAAATIGVGSIGTGYRRELLLLSLACVVASVVVAVAALYLERSCVVPPGDDGPGGGSAHHALP